MRILAFGKSGAIMRRAIFACLPAVMFAPAAHALNRIGWAYADQPAATAAYTPKMQYSFNSANGSVSVLPTNGQAGNYTVYFTKLFQGALHNVGSNVLVSVADGTSAHCTAGSGPPVNKTDTTATVTVQCYNRLGQPANAAFTVLYQIRNAPFGSATSGLAYLHQGSSDSTTVTLYSFNSTGGTNTAVQSRRVGIGPGNYTVTIPGFTAKGGDVQVSTAANEYEFAPTHCKAVSWVPGSSATTITVQCYRMDNGNPVYSGFDVAYAMGDPFGGLFPGDGTVGGVWLFANDLTSTTPYKPLLNHQFNGFKTGAMTAQKTGTGKYTVTIPGTFTYTTSTALVTASDTGNGYCNLASWAHATINVVCYDRAGALADSRFNVTLQTAS